MVFYATTGNYSDPERYEQFARECGLDKKAFEIGSVVRDLTFPMQNQVDPVEILETASATGLTAVGVKAVLKEAGIHHVYTSLDKEQSLLDYAEARERGDVFMQGDFENLPFGSDAFDIYIMMGAEGYRPRGTFYSEARRVLRHGGCFIMPQIGPRPFVNEKEKGDAMAAGFEIIRVDNYFVARKP